MEPGSAGKSGLTAIVEHEYTAKEPDELTLVKGAVITNVKTMSGGWWEGTLANGKRGMFPDNFVVLQESEDKNVVLRDKTNAIVQRCKVVFSYQENNSDELSLAVGDIIEVLGEVEEGWWRGKLKGRVGVFPSNFVEVIPNPSPVSANRQSVTSTVVAANTTNSILRNNRNSSSLSNSREDLLSNNNASHDLSDAPSLPPKPVREVCKVLFAYEPCNEDELKLVEGDLITVLNKELPDKGWWKGELRGKIGVFPDNFVQLLPSEAVVSPHKEASARPERPPHVGKSSLMGNQQRKDSFGSKDSLSSETNRSSPITRSSTGPVFSAHRKSLEHRNHELISDKPPRKTPELKNSDVRKSVESLEDKKATPPPVTKKPVVPIKKSPSITSVTNNLFSGLKSKVKGGDKSLDSADGLAGSKPQVAESAERGVVGEKITLRGDKEEFDTVERSSMLVDPRASRAKAPRRRPPSSSQSLSIDQGLNGSGEHAPESPREAENSEGELVKPKTREWEKHKVPWMDELKASQMKKTSPGHTIAQSGTQEAMESITKSFSSSSFKSDSAPKSSSNQADQSNLLPTKSDLMTRSMTTSVSRISIGDKPEQNHLYEPSARTRSISPGRHEADRVANLEEWILKLERVVVKQGAAIDELTKQLSEESAKVRELKKNLDKYAQCVTQV